jgi:hypothetical protein
MAKATSISRESAESLAVQALAFLAAEPDRLGRFLAETGIAPEAIRTAATSPGFLMGVLDHLLADERLLIAFAEEAEIAPEDIGRARAGLGRPYERDIP